VHRQNSMIQQSNVVTTKRSVFKVQLTKRIIRKCANPANISEAQLAIFRTIIDYSKLKCCQSPNLVHDPSFGCYVVKADKDNIKSLVNRGNGCPVDVLTGVGFTNGTNLIGRYCSLSLVGLDYKNTTCKEDRQRDLAAPTVSHASKVGKGFAELLTVMFALYFVMIFVH